MTNDIHGNDSYIFVNSNNAFAPDWTSTSVSAAYYWMCQADALDQTDSDALKNVCKRAMSSSIRARASSSHWVMHAGAGKRTVFFQVEYCMAEKQAHYCKLQYSFPLTMLVIGFNLVKSSILLYTWLGIPDAPILTIGDAITSFLHHPDPSSQNGCFLTSREVKSMRQSLSNKFIRKPLHKPRAFKDRRKSWYSAASGRRWALTICIWILAIIVCLALLAYGMNAVGRDSGRSSVWALSLGSTSPQTFIYSNNWPTTLVPNVIIANSPQLIFSFVYVAFNGTLTAMTLAAEWSGYANQRKGLRVSHHPRRSQRTNYFLSIPYRYSIPLLVFSTAALAHLTDLIYGWC